MDEYQHLKDAIRQEAEMRTQERFSNSPSNQIKNLNASVVSAVGNVPILKEPLQKVGGALTNAFGFFTDNVLAPIFGFDDREAREKETRRQERIIGKTIRKTALRERQAEEYSRGMEDFQRKAEQAGFDSTAEYSAFLRRTRRTRRKRI